MKKETDITGRRFGRLVAVRPLGKGGSFQLQWLCRCDCGNMVTVCKKNLMSGNTKSCGCYRRDYLKSLRDGTTTVGLGAQDRQETL